MKATIAVQDHKFSLTSGLRSCREGRRSRSSLRWGRSCWRGWSPLCWPAWWTWRTRCPPCMPVWPPPQCSAPRWWPAPRCSSLWAPATRNWNIFNSLLELDKKFIIRCFGSQILDAYWRGEEGWGQWITWWLFVLTCFCWPNAKTFKLANLCISSRFGSFSSNSSWLEKNVWQITWWVSEEENHFCLFEHSNLLSGLTSSLVENTEDGVRQNLTDWHILNIKSHEWRTVLFFTVAIRN